MSEKILNKVLQYLSIIIMLLKKHFTGENRNFRLIVEKGFI